MSISVINLKTTNNTHVERFMGISYEDSIFGDASGYSVAGANLNCDGKEYLIISDPNASPLGRSGAGIIYVVPNNGGNLTSSIKIYGASESGITGPLAVVKNFKNNCDTLLIGSENLIYMLSGNPSFTGGDLEFLTPPEVIKITNCPYYSFGDAGYFFGPDKKKAIAISVKEGQYGATYIIQEEFFSQNKDVSFKNLDLTFSTIIYGPVANGAFGSSIAGGINFNGNKFDAVALGCPGWNNDQGMVAVIPGSNITRNISVTVPSNNDVTIITGVNGYQGQVGYALSVAKNFNHDITCDTLFMSSPATGVCFAVWCTDSKNIYLGSITSDIGIKIQNLSNSEPCGFGFGLAGTANMKNENGYVTIADQCAYKAYLVPGGSNLRDIDINNGTTYQGLVFEEVDGLGVKPIAIVENFEGKNDSSIIIGSTQVRNSKGYLVGETYFVEDVLSLIPTHPTMHPTHPTMHPTHPTMPTVPTESPTADASNAGSWWLTDGGIATMASVGAFILGMVGLCCYCKFKAHDDATGFTPMND